MLNTTFNMILNLTSSQHIVQSGLGTKLISSLIQMKSNNGLKEMETSVNLDNQPSIKDRKNWQVNTNRLTVEPNICN